MMESIVTTAIAAVSEGAGFYGRLANTVTAVAFTGSAVLLFIYLWYRGRLDMDEKPKWQMMESEDKNSSTDNDKGDS